MEAHVLRALVKPKFQNRSKKKKAERWQVFQGWFWATPLRHMRTKITYGTIKYIVGSNLAHQNSIWHIFSAPSPSPYSVDIRLLCWFYFKDATCFEDVLPFFHFLVSCYFRFDFILVWWNLHLNQTLKRKSFSLIHTNGKPPSPCTNHAWFWPITGKHQVWFKFEWN